jgi:methylglutamate dehydrogenase subunit D
MPDRAPHVRTPLQGVIVAGRFGASVAKPGLIVEEVSDLALGTVAARRGREQDLGRTISEAYGIELPNGPRSIERNGVSFAGIAVGQWFVAARHPATKDFLSSLRARLAGLASVADQSDGRVVLRLSGDCVRNVLAKGVPVDLHPRSFKAGDVASTTIAYMGVQLQQLDDLPTFQLMAFRSLAGSLWSWLTASAAEFGYEVVQAGALPPRLSAGSTSD